jgi:hypothetical protein
MSAPTTNTPKKQQTADPEATEQLLSSLRRRQSLRSSPREKSEKKKEKEIVSGSDNDSGGGEDASEFGGGSSSSDSEAGDIASVLVEEKVRVVEEKVEEDEDEDDHFQTPVKVTPRNKRVIESDSSSALSSVGEDPTDSDELENLRPVVKRKKAPKKPKFDFLGGHPELRTVWEDIDGTQEAINIPAVQPPDILLKVFCRVLTASSFYPFN